MVEMHCSERSIFDIDIFRDMPESTGAAHKIFGYIRTSNMAGIDSIDIEDIDASSGPIMMYALLSGLKRSIPCNPYAITIDHLRYIGGVQIGIETVLAHIVGRLRGRNVEIVAIFLSFIEAARVFGGDGASLVIIVPTIGTIVCTGPPAYQAAVAKLIGRRGRGRCCGGRGWK